MIYVLSFAATNEPEWMEKGGLFVLCEFLLLVCSGACSNFGYFTSQLSVIIYHVVVDVLRYVESVLRIATAKITFTDFGIKRSPFLHAVVVVVVGRKLVGCTEFPQFSFEEWHSSSSLFHTFVPTP